MPHTPPDATERRLPAPYYADDAVTIYHGDCMEIMPLLGAVDHVITDPPYGDTDTHATHLSGVTLRDGTPAGQSLGFDGVSQHAMIGLCDQFLSVAQRWCVFTCEWKYVHALPGLVRMGIWRKPDGAPQFTGDRPGTGWEAVAILHREGKKRWNGGGKHAFWEYPKGSNRTGHPTGKPVELFAQFLADFTDPGDLILDPFMGAGTTLRAAKDMGRRAIGIEINRDYCDIAAQRMRQEVLC
jgi:site-specific DNA-methyltransferase (adenine-specific)